MLPSKNDPYKLYLGDCLDILKEIPENSIDAVVTDPPYGIKFLASHWDYDIPSIETWEAILRVLKPGGHLLSFGGTRTQHRMICAIEDAGFEIRDLVSWVYGQGMPKSYDISKGIDKSKGLEREVIGQREDILLKQHRDFERGYRKIKDSYDGGAPDRNNGFTTISADITAPASPEAQQWEGWGTALKPALEPICLARKPLIGTIVENVLEHGTGGLNIDGCRVPMTSEDAQLSKNNWKPQGYELHSNLYEYGSKVIATEQNKKGRWPSNMIHDGSDDVLTLFKRSESGGTPKIRNADGDRNVYGEFKGQENVEGRPASRGSAARFFYCAKASPEDRAEGTTAGNNHPTLKPVSLMQYLVRLITPPRGIVLDPFMGSGSTGKACMMEGFFFIGIEKEEEYFKIAQERIEDKKKKVLTWW